MKMSILTTTLSMFVGLLFKAFQHFLQTIYTAKNAQSNMYLEILTTSWQTWHFFFTFYEYHTARNCFSLYQRRQRAPEMMVNMLLHEGSKYSGKKQNK
jgi:hypothetical protein